MPSPESNQGKEISKPTKTELRLKQQNNIRDLGYAQTPAEIRNAIGKIYAPEGRDVSDYMPTNPDSELPAIKQRMIEQSEQILKDLETKSDGQLGTKPERKI